MERTELIQQKILDQSRLAPVLARWRFHGRKIVFTNGCFDLLHLGHIDYLAKASDCGDVLIIGLNTDASVRRLKGPSRPFNDEKARAMVLAALSFVDAVVLFDEDTPIELIRFVAPDVLVKGNDYKAEEIVGYDLVTLAGGVVKTIELVEGYSTSLLETKIRNLSRTD